MLIFLLILLFLLFFKKNKFNFTYHNVLLVVFLIFIIIFMGGNINNPDSSIYYNMYYSSSLFTKDPLFGIIINISKWLGLDIFEFKLIISTIGLMLIYSVANKYLKKSGMFVFSLLYLTFPFFYDIIQLRNFLGLAIAIYAISVFDVEKKFHFFESIILLIMAGLIQKTHFLWFLFLIISNFIQKKSFRNIFIFLTFLFSVMCLSNNVSSYITNILLNLDIQGLDAFANRVTNYGWLIYYFIYFIEFLICGYCYKRIKNVKFFDNVYKIFLASSICLPLYILNPTFSRIIRNVSVLVFMLWGYFIENYKFKDRNTKFFVHCAILLVSVINFSLIYLPNMVDFQNIVVKPFSNNWILFENIRKELKCII